jgi:KDO2-lipid IV(A) lauroyltransferase
MTAYLQYLIVKGFSFLINLPPEAWALGFGRLLGRVTFYLDREHRKVALQNLELAFGGEKSKEELETIARETFQNLGMNAVEFFRIPRMDFEAFRRQVAVEGLENLQKVLDNEKKGVLFLLSHFGSWELMVLMPVLLGHPSSVIARPIKKNRWIDRMVSEIRGAAGLEVIFTEKAGRKVLRALSQNRFVGILIDQRAKRSEGVWVDFFGKKAPTTPSLAILAMRTGAPVIPFFMVRDGFSKHRVLIQKPLEMVDSGDIQKDVETNTQRINDTLESVIRQYPDQWFWVHRRWERKKKVRSG